MLVRLATFALFLALGCSGVDSATTSAQEPGPYAARADSSAGALLRHYWRPESGYFFYGNRGDSAYHYWPQAHALDVILDAYARTGDPKHRQVIEAWRAGVFRKNKYSFLNDYYDDMLWNALAMLRAYEATGDERFRAAVDTLWTDITGGWTGAAGGGIMWSKPTPNSKNAISNAPASLLASRLYRLTGDDAYLEWARKTYAWQQAKLVDPATGAVWDHVIAENGAERIRKEWVFTYNQGMYLAAAHALYQITDSAAYLDDAMRAADYALARLSTPDGLLRDEGSGDGGLFKGIFVRYLAQLILEDDLPAAARARYAAFLKRNADALWNEGANREQMLFGSYWKTRPAADAEIHLTVQLSGAMLLEAAALLEREGALE